MLDAWGMKLEKVIIHSLKDNTFYALLIVRQGDNVREVDARPSDAIALALRSNCPIWVMEEVVADASIPVDRDADEAERQAFRDLVSDISPSQLIHRSRYGA
jgi:bifunctional DNase/RNase